MPLLMNKIAAKSAPDFIAVEYKIAEIQSVEQAHAYAIKVQCNMVHAGLRAGLLLLHVNGMSVINSTDLLDFSRNYLGFNKDKTYALMRAAKRIVEAGVTGEEAESIGWTKLDRICRVLTSANKDFWLERAKALPRRDLEALVQQERGSPNAPAPISLKPHLPKKPAMVAKAYTPLVPVKGPSSLAPPQFHFRPFQFGLTKKGVQQAIATAKVGLGLGFAYVGRLDIVDHFASFDPDRLATVLPLPQGWVDYVVSGRHLRARADQVHGLPKCSAVSPASLTSLLEEARRGIPTGSRCSPIVSAYCMAKLSWVDTDDVWLINYVDDFLILARTQSALEEAMAWLTEQVAGIPGGSFQLEVLYARPTSLRFEFLGHDMQVRKNKVSVEPNNAAWLAFMEQQDRIPGKPAPKIVLLTRFSEILSYMRGWKAAFSEGDSTTAIYNIGTDELFSKAHTLGLTRAEIEANVNPVDIDFGAFS